MKPFTESQIYSIAKACDSGRYGGFMQSIGRALLLADLNNQERLIQAFYDTFEKILSVEAEQ